MLSTNQFIKLAYTPDLTEAGIQYAVRSLHYTYDRMGGSLYSRLRRIVGGVAVELALRRSLTEQDIPFDIKGATPFTEPDRYDLSLGGHRVDLKTFIISKRNQISTIRRDLKQLLQAPALIPEDQFVSANHNDADLYLFAFLLGLSTNSPEDIQKAFDAGQKTYLIHPLQSSWARPSGWLPLGRISLKSECTIPITVELGGQNADREFITHQIELEPLKRETLTLPLHNLAYLHANEIPDARIGIHSAAKSETYLIQPHEWGNIWIYGMDIWLTGYMARDEFRRKANVIHAGSRVFQYSKTQTKNLSVSVGELRPLNELFDLIKNQ